MLRLWRFQAALQLLVSECLRVVVRLNRFAFLLVCGVLAIIVFRIAEI